MGEQESEGQVSEASSMGGGPEPISDDQSVAGQPHEDDVQEGRQGPNARSGSRDEAHRNDDYVKDGEVHDPAVDRDLEA